MTEVIRLHPDDLVLHVSETVNPKQIDLFKYDDFIDELCGNRDFQKEAIRTVIRYLLGGRYSSTKELAKENYDSNETLQEFYKSFRVLEEKLEFGDQLSCAIDLATATGKSYVMFGIAQILLSEGAVDQVLVLCPSVTIESGLIEKFKGLSGNKQLKATLPSDAVIKNPRIIQGNTTIQKGDICVENYHAILEHVSSSISYSLAGLGSRTLILNDEAHHLMNPKAETSATDSQGMKKWKEFIINPKFGFKFVINFTGTPYIGNNYFSDVVYRYPILKAMGDHWIKKIEYVDENEAKNWGEKIQQIYDNHVGNKNRYKEYKPLTILVTQKIALAEDLAEDIIKFLVIKEKISREAAERKVLVVTSSSKHKKNVELLKKVDDKDDPTEWITSVSMLTEGWDVKNVFQIVPHDKRAFNSKLLIAQVLGRGLRVPEKCSYQPTLIVFNHEKWREDVRELVYEIMGYEEKIHSYVVDKTPDYNFNLYNINYEPIERVVREKSEVKRVSVPGEKNLIKFSQQDRIIKRRSKYFIIGEEKADRKVTEIEVPTKPILEVANDIFNKLYLDGKDDQVDYLKGLTRKRIEAIIKKSLEAIGDTLGVLTEENVFRAQTAFGSLKKKTSSVVIVDFKSSKPFEVSTKKMPHSTALWVDLLKNKTLLFNKESVAKSKDEDAKMLLKAFDKLPREKVIEVANSYNFKCPLNAVILSYGNEKKFGEYLTDPNYACHMDAWIKSVDRGFYKIPYTHRKYSELDVKYGKRSGHQQDAEFNPDFFMKLGHDILVVEIKANEDITAVNKAKLKYAKKHFAELNKKQKKQKYYFFFLSPEDFSKFFEAIKNKRYQNYHSNLEVDLENA